MSNKEINYFKFIKGTKWLPEAHALDNQIINLNHVVCVNLIKDAPQIEIIFIENGSTLHTFNSEAEAQKEFEKLLSAMC